MFSFTFYFDSKYVIMQKKKKKKNKKRKRKVLRNDIKEESIYLPKAIC